jgi:hypothetical protein
VQTQATCAKPGPGKNLDGCDFSGQDLSGKNLNGSSLRGTLFTGATLRGTNLSDSNAKGATFHDAKLCGANLSASTLTNTDFTDADLTKADLHASACKGADFTGATLCQTKTCNGKVDNSGCPSGSATICCADADCPASTPTCRNHQCSGCATDNDCGAHQRCCGGACVTGVCCTGTDCGPRGNNCVSAGGGPADCICGTGSLCPATQTCCPADAGATNAGACVDVQTSPANCGKCGNECSSGQLCCGGRCCTPNCTGRSCGPNLCGATCGTCGGGLVCTSSGKCAASCIPVQSGPSSADTCDPNNDACCAGLFCGSNGVHNVSMDCTRGGGSCVGFGPRQCCSLICSALLICQ